MLVVCAHGPHLSAPPAAAHCGQVVRNGSDGRKEGEEWERRREALFSVSM